MFFPYLKLSVQQTSEFPNEWIYQCKQVIEGWGLCASKVNMTFSFKFLYDILNVSKAEWTAELLPFCCAASIFVRWCWNCTAMILPHSWDRKAAYHCCNYKIWLNHHFTPLYSVWQHMNEIQRHKCCIRSLWCDQRAGGDWTVMEQAVAQHNNWSEAAESLWRHEDSSVISDFPSDHSF